MSKVAVIFHGIRGGMKNHNGVGDPVDIAECAETIKYNLIRHYDCDIFIHSWSEESKEEIENLYKPTKSLFQPQEYFSFDPKADLSHRFFGQAFRTASRYTSLHRAVYLKHLYEVEKGFKYDWNVVLRFDLVLFNKIKLDNLDNKLFYGCHIPEWLSLHDLIYVSGSDVMDEFSTAIHDINMDLYNPADAHMLLIHKLNSMYKFDTTKYGNYVGQRYKDIEIYRFVKNPELIVEKEAPKFGALEMPERFKTLLNTIRNEAKNNK